MLGHSRTFASPSFPLHLKLLYETWKLINSQTLINCFRDQSIRHLSISFSSSTQLLPAYLPIPMAATAATAAGAAVLMYFVVSRKLCCCKGEVEDDDLLKSRGGRRKRRVVVQAAPATWQESISTLSETLRFMYSETLAKWPLGDLAFGINYFMRRQGNLQVASVYAGTNSVQLKGPEMIVELNSLLRLLTFCIFFSKKPFPVFLESAGYSQSDVLLQKPKAGLLKPAFTILCDKSSKCFLLLIRGTHSIKDTLTAATGAVVPFHHSVLHDGGISNLVLGYAHCGMVAAARWISKLSIPVLIKALNEYPGYKVKVVGHSLGGGTAALLTYILREQIELSSSICVTFAPAACMTWDLAESGKHIITTVINNSDLVPTFSASSVDNLRSEVRASSWLNDMRDQVEHTRGLNVVYRSASSLSSSIARTKARVIGAGSFLQPVSSSTKVMMKRAQSGAQNVAQVVVRTRSSIIMVLEGARRRVVAPISTSEVDTLERAPLVPDRSPETLVAEVVLNKPVMEELGCDPSCGGSEQDDPDEEERVAQVDRVVSSSTEGDDITEGELWLEIDRELRRHEHETSINCRTDEEEVAVVKEITEEENLLANATERANMNTSDTPENRHFYPPGRIMHIVSIPSSDTNNQVTDVPPPSEEHICIYETPRNLYSKLRLTKTMINDHYMPMYKRKIELLIKEMEKEELQSCELSQVCM